MADASTKTDGETIEAGIRRLIAQANGEGLHFLAYLLEMALVEAKATSTRTERP